MLFGFTNSTKRISILIGSSLAVLLAVVVIFTILTRANNNRKILTALRVQNVPVVQVTTPNRVNYHIEILLQSESDNQNLLPEDNWNLVFASRTATQAYRNSIRFKSYTLILRNTKGDIITSYTTFLYPKDLNLKASQIVSTLDTDQTAEIILNDLDFSGLTLEELSLVPYYDTPASGLILNLELSTRNLQTANQSLPVFLSTFFRFLETGNQRNGTNIVLVRLRLIDQSGSTLLDFVRDLDGGISRWRMEGGLYSDWFPKPELASRPTLTPLATASYPAPPSDDFSLPTLAAYP